MLRNAERRSADQPQRGNNWLAGSPLSMTFVSPPCARKESDGMMTTGCNHSVPPCVGCTTEWERDDLKLKLTDATAIIIATVEERDALRAKLALAEKVVQAARVEFKSGSLSDYSKFLDALRAYDAALAEWERGECKHQWVSEVKASLPPQYGPMKCALCGAVK